MLVAGKDSFHKSIFLQMTEGSGSKTYNTNESQDEVDELIKGKLSEEKDRGRGVSEGEE